ncbi:MAG: recombinase family protein [Actinomycetota bacterium]|nr:recombinase family protein [Actinomycetota bacterium]
MKGYSIRQQLAALRDWCEANGYDVLEEVKDEGFSGAFLDRSGLDRALDLVRTVAGVAVVVAQDADRITREPGHRMILDEECERSGTRLIALDDWGDDSHEGHLLKFMRGWVSKGEKLKFAERTRRGSLRKVSEGRVLGVPRSPATGSGGRRTTEGRTSGTRSTSPRWRRCGASWRWSPTARR